MARTGARYGMFTYNWSQSVENVVFGQLTWIISSRFGRVGATITKTCNRSAIRVILGKQGEGYRNA